MAIILLANEDWNRYPLYVDTLGEDRRSGCQFLTYLLSFWGNVVLGEDANVNSQQKPILILATSPQSLQTIQYLYSRDSFLVRNGTIKCYEEGMHYSVCALPMPFQVDICHHDVVLCHVDCYKSLPRDGFKLVVVHQSNILEVEENRSDPPINGKNCSNWRPLLW